MFRLNRGYFVPHIPETEMESLSCNTGPAPPEKISCAVGCSQNLIGRIFDIISHVSAADPGPLWLAGRFRIVEGLIRNEFTGMSVTLSRRIITGECVPEPFPDRGLGLAEISGLVKVRPGRVLIRLHRCCRDCGQNNKSESGQNKIREMVKNGVHWFTPFPAADRMSFLP